MSTLDGRTAIVCGSTQGIGHACAVALARAGAAVTLVARDAEALARAAAALPADAGQEHGHVCGDFSDWTSVRDRVAAHVAGHGPVHILVNNTGGPGAGPAIDAEPAQFAAGFAQHVLANQALVQVVTPGMKDAGYGRIINIISTSVVMPIRGLGVSNTIRGAVANWGRILAAELGPFGITVNNVLPGYTATTRLNGLLQRWAERDDCTVDDVVARLEAGIPARRFADPSEVGAVVAFLASPAASYVSGVNLPVDGGRLAAQ